MGDRIASLYAELSADDTKLKKSLGKAKDDLGGLGKEIKKLSLTDLKSGFDLAGQAVDAFTGVFRKAFDMGEAGAELEYMQGKFDNLAASIGTTSGMLMGDLRAATKGLVSDAQLVGSAGDFMALGLAKSHDEVVRLTKVAGALGMDMNQLVLTLTNQTTMRFDALGVSVDGFKERVDGLKKSGMDANSAFTEAFLQQAEAQIAKVGDKADSNVASFMRLEAAGKNLGDAILKWVADPLANAADGATALLTATDRINSAFEEHREEIEKTSTSYAAYREEFIRSAEAAGKWNINMTTAEMEGMGVAVEELFRSLGGLTEAELANKQSMAASDEHLSRLADQYRNAAGGVSDLAAAEEDLEAVQARLQSQMGDLGTIVGGQFGNENEDFADTQERIREEIDKTQSKLSELTGKSYLTQDQKSQIEELQGKLQDLQGELDETAKAHEDAMKRMAFNMLQERASADGYTQNEVDNLTNIAEAWGLYDEKTAEVVRAVNGNLSELDTSNPEELVNLLERIMGVPETKNFDYYVNVEGLDDLERMLNLIESTGGAAANAGRGAEAGGGNQRYGSGGYADPGTGSGFASGADFVVPAGYPNDTYPMRVSSGEHVQVTPAGKSDKAPVQVILNVYDITDWEMATRRVTDLQRRLA